MNQSLDREEPKPREDPRQISKWTRIYAQNRSLGVVVSLVIFVLLAAAIGGPSYLAGQAYRSGNVLLLSGCLVVLAAATVALFYFSNPFWGGKLIERLAGQLYAKEGNVAFAATNREKKLPWALLLVEFLAVCVMMSVVIGLVVEVPTKYMQPISALYMVPFLVGLWWLMRPMAGYLALLWPLLYGVHAILIVAGAPILFTGPWDVLNMFLPVAGYGILAAFASHVYGRYALCRLRRLTQTELTAGNQQHEVPGE